MCTLHKSGANPALQRGVPASLQDLLSDPDTASFQTTPGRRGSKMDRRTHPPLADPDLSSRRIVRGLTEPGSVAVENRPRNRRTGYGIGTRATESAHGLRNRHTGCSRPIPCVRSASHDERTRILPCASEGVPTSSATSRKLRHVQAGHVQAGHVHARRNRIGFRSCLADCL